MRAAKHNKEKASPDSSKKPFFMHMNVVKSIAQFSTWLQVITKMKLIFRKLIRLKSPMIQHLILEKC